MKWAIGSDLKTQKRSWKIVFSLGIIALLLSSCLSSANTDQGGGESSTSNSTSVSYAEVEFVVDVPEKSPVDQGIFLDILDEVTGLGINPLRYQMNPGTEFSQYSLRIPVPLGSVVKYRYVRGGTPPAIEYSSVNEQVRYRLLSVDGPIQVKDSVSGWNDIPYEGLTGRIQGRVVDKTTGLPVSGVLVQAGGMDTVTSADGSYLLDGMSLGTHNLVAYSLDGAFKPFQQGAVVAAEASTPATLELTPTHFVNVVFQVRPPSDSMSGMPVRMVGNLYNLGNTYADLDGGVSVVASRAPLMTLNSDGTYSLVLSLPAGFDFRYKYTLGDGFWNAEHDGDVRFKIRQLIVPQQDTIIEDTIETWRSGEFAPVTFTIRVPENTPSEDTVSIQFSPFGWTEAIPMWPLGDNQWLYILYSPLDLLGEVKYRICRNDQCGLADDIATAGEGEVGFVFSGSPTEQTFEYEVTDWNNWDLENAAATVATSEITNRGGNFIAGVELQSDYHPSWQPYLGSAFSNIRSVGSNWVVLSPTWSYTRVNLPVIEVVPGRDAALVDMQQMISWAKMTELNVALFPQVHYPNTTDEWWMSATRDSGWWNSWFDRYYKFVLHHAIMAAQVDANLLILGEPGGIYALPDGKLVDGNSSGVPVDADNLWRQMISDVRDRFGGSLAWAIEYSDNLSDVPEFVSEVDQIYILWSAPLSDNGDASQAEMIEEFGRRLDADIKPLVEQFGKPVIIGLQYPSVDGAVSNCIQSVDGCMSNDEFIKPSSDDINVSLDYNEQADIYNAALLAINQRDWVQGFISRGYYPPASLQDASSSVHGKAAANVLWYWYPRMLGAIVD